MRTISISSMRYFGLCRVLVVIVFALWLDRARVPAAAQATPQPGTADAAARAAFEEGRAAYDRGRFTEALAKFERAYALSGNAKLLFNIGRAADGEGEQQRAYDAYSAYLQRVPDADNREFVEARLARLSAKPASPAGSTAANPSAARRTPSHAAPAATSAPPVARQAPPASRPAQGRSPATPLPDVYRSPSPNQAATPSEADKPGRARLYAGMRFGGAGSATVTFDDSEYTSEADSDLHASFGAQLGFELVPSRFFGIGLETRIISTKLEGAAERDRLIDFVVKPSGRYALRRAFIEFYGALPIGVVVPTPGVSSWDTKPGATVGFMAGMNWFFRPHLGLNFELGALYHWFSATTPIGDLHYAMSEFTWLTANLVYAL